MQQNAAAQMLRQRLESGKGVARLIGAHNALGARMAERAGFDGVWSSGLELSASFGVPDASLVTMSEHLAALQAMCYSVASPILADCDTGYGDDCNVAYMVRKFEAAGVAGVTIEDKCFPKHNSFVEGCQDLVPIDLFAAKIAGARQARRDADFLVVARTEALIAGLGPEEALRRAHAYADAGADAILFHSKERSVAQIAEVLRAWQQRLPVVLVPTTYPDVDLGELERLGVRMVIYANHGLRSSLRAMERTYAEILRSGSTRSVEPFLWPLSSVLDFVDLGHPLHLQGQNGHELNGHGLNGHALHGDARNGHGLHGHGFKGIPLNGHQPAPVAERAVAKSAPPVAAGAICDLLRGEGIDFCAGVPDSTMAGLFLALEARPDLDYHPAVSEEAALGLATGAYLGGRQPALLMQNSGLGTAVTALASLALPYGIPLLLLVGWRGVDGDDTPEHRVLGETTLDLLRLLGIPFEVLDPERPAAAISRAAAAARRAARPAAVVVRRGVIR